MNGKELVIGRKYKYNLLRKQPVSLMAYLKEIEAAIWEDGFQLVSTKPYDILLNQEDQPPGRPVLYRTMCAVDFIQLK